MTNNDIKESVFLEDLKQHIKDIEILNEEHEEHLEFMSIINGLQPIQDSGSKVDFYYQDFYLEKFELDGSLLVQSPNKSKSMQSKHLTIDKRNEKNIKLQNDYRKIVGTYAIQPQDKDLKTIYNMRDNLIHLIRKKVDKIEKYKLANPNFTFLNLIIDVKSDFEYYVNENGEYCFDKALVEKYPIKRIYDISKDFNLMQKIISEFGTKIKFLLFVNSYNKEKHLSIINLQQPINEQKFIKYPNEFIHLKEGYMSITHCQHNDGTTLIKFRPQAECLIIYADKLKINNFDFFRKDCSIFASKEDAVIFETSQFVLAPNATIINSALFKQYKSLFIGNTLTLNVEGSIYSLDRITKLEDYYLNINNQNFMLLNPYCGLIDK